jgi:hypothetical protein
MRKQVTVPPAGERFSHLAFGFAVQAPLGSRLPAPGRHVIGTTYSAGAIVYLSVIMKFSLGSLDLDLLLLFLYRHSFLHPRINDTFTGWLPVDCE